MAIGLPAPEVVNLYERLLRLTAEDEVEVARITWRLRSLLRSSPSDLSVKVALIEALTLQGSVNEAHEFTDTVWHARALLEIDVARSFALGLINLGRFEQFLEFGPGCWESPTGQNDALLSKLLSQAYWGIGNLQSFVTFDAKRAAFQGAARDCQEFRVGPR